MPLPSVLEGRLRLPVVVAPLFLASGPRLVIGSCRAGVLGSFPALNQRTTSGFAEWVDEIRAALGPDDAPFGVNLIVHPVNTRLEADLEVVIRSRVPVVITSLGAVSDVVDAVHGYGGVVFHDVATGRHAEKAAKSGVDGLVLVSGGAGGHAGTLNPFALLAEARRVFDGTILLAGCLSTGADVLAAQAMGADLAYMGTRFLATKQSQASPAYKQMIVDSGASDIVYTPSISTLPANFLRPSIAAAGLDPDLLARPEKVDLRHLVEPSSSKAWRDIWTAGQGVAAITDVPSVAELVDRIEAEYTAARRRLLG